MSYFVCLFKTYEMAKKRRLKKKVKRNLYFIAAAVAVAVVVSLARTRYIENDRKMITVAETAVPAHQYRYSKIFNDLNDRQLVSARKLGIEPVDSRDQVSTSRLRSVKSCRLYEVQPLTHSIPFLVPEAKRLLEDIGRGFRDSLPKYGLKGFCPVVTSLTRTGEDVRSLRKSGNINASKTSCHCYGTTFDLSFTKFYKFGGREHPTVKSVLMKQILAEVVENLHRQGRCYVKYEYKQACFHITVRSEE